MTTAPSTTCYRHPDREAGRHCTRCGRPACAECLVQASVGSHCLDCARAGTPPPATRARLRLRGENMLATKTIVAVNIAMFLYIGVRDGRLDGGGATSRDLALFGPSVHHGEWWRLFTNSVVHYNVTHILFNMLMLWLVGQLLEPGAGRVRFTVLYLVSVAAGSAGALLVSPHALTGGASGGVFGVAAAATLVMQRQGVRFWDTGFGPLLVINLVISFVVPNISVGGHIGGLIGGALAAEAMMQARRAEQPKLGIVAAGFVGVAAILLAFSVAGN